MLLMPRRSRAVKNNNHDRNVTEKNILERANLMNIKTIAVLLLLVTVVLGWVLSISEPDVKKFDCELLPEWGQENQLKSSAISG